MVDILCSRNCDMKQQHVNSVSDALILAKFKSQNSNTFIKIKVCHDTCRDFPLWMGSLHTSHVNRSRSIRHTSTDLAPYVTRQPISLHTSHVNRSRSIRHTSTDLAPYVTRQPISLHTSHVNRSQRNSR